jgi:hypothetical protein
MERHQLFDYLASIYCGGERAMTYMRSLFTRRMPRILLAGFALLALATAVFSVHRTIVDAAAGINPVVTYQGRLLDSTGAVIPDGTYNIRFKIYQDGDGTTAGDASGSPTGALKWTEIWQNSNSQGVTVKNGYFTVGLGTICSLSGGTCQGNTNAGVNFNQDTLWLSIDVAGTSASATPTYDGEMLPMRRLTSSVYALDAGTLGGLTAAQFLQYSVGTVQTDSSSNSTISLNKTGASGNIIELQGASGADVFAINNAGQAVFRPQTDSQTALQVQKAGTTTTAFTVDTTNTRIGIGLGTPLYALDAVGTVRASVSLKIGGVDVCTSSGCTPAAGSSYYIQNQSASPQSANFYTQTTSNSVATATLQVISSQTADVLDVTDSSGGIIAGIGANGNIFTGPTTTSSCGTAITGGVPTSAQLFSQPCNSTSTAIVARAAASGTPTGDILDVQDASGSNNLVSVAASGATTIKANSGTAFMLQDTSNNSLLTVDTNNQRANIGQVIGTPTSQLYIGGLLPTTQTSFVATAAKTPLDMKVVGNYAYVATTSTGTDGLAIYDVTKPTAPVQIGAVSNAGVPEGVDVAGHYAYTADSGGTMTVYNVINPAAPTVVTSLSLGAAGPRRIVVQGEYAYIANLTNSKLYIVNISNPAVPVLTSTTTTFKNWGIAVQGKYVYLPDSNAGQLRIYNASNPASPSVTATISITGSSAPWGISVQGSYAYIADDGNDKFYVINISNPASPSLVGTVSLPTGVNGWSVEVQGRYAYVEGNGDGVHFGSTYNVIDISNPASPTVLGTVASPSNSLSAGESGQDVFIQGRYLYSLVSGTAATGGIYIYDMGGAYLQQTETGGTQTGKLTVDSDATIAGNINIQGGLQIAGSLYASNGLSIDATTTFSVPAGTFTAGQLAAGGETYLTVDTTTSTSEVLRIGTGAVNTDDFPTLTQLDNKTSSTDPTGIEGGMYFDVATKSFRCFFGSGANGRWRSCSAGVVFANTNAPTKTSGINQVVNTASETAFASSYTIPANDCTPGRVYNIYVRGTYNTAATAPTMQLRMRLDSTSGTVLAASQATIVAGSASALGWEMQGQIICFTSGASGTVDAQGYESFVNRGNGQGTTSRAEQNPVSVSSAVTVDTTVSHTLLLTMQWNTASTSNYIIARQFIVEASGP